MKGRKVIILNGMARAGKDTLCEYLNQSIPTYHYSSVSFVKELAKEVGWTGQKTEKDRKFLSDLKLLLTEYNDTPFNDMKSIYNDFISGYLDAKILVFDIREPAEIERAKKEFNAITLFITNKNVQQVTSNMADANVFNYVYDYTLDNSGTLEELKLKANNFAAFLSSMIKDGEID